LAAWGGCFAFAAQIYFDFSGYSDMAVGLGLLFNFRLPINFAAPLRAASMLDLWRRWHITLSRLAKDLIYVPLALGRGPVWRAAALITTMVVIGIWHGAGWTFVAWGAYNGVLLQINTVWRNWRGVRRVTRGGRLLGWAMTITAFAVGCALFRAADFGAATHLLTAMGGYGGAPIAERHLPLDDWMVRHGYVSGPWLRAWFGTSWSMVATFWTVGALAVILLVPDTLEFADYREGEPQSDWRRPVGFMVWRPAPVFLGVTMVIFVAVFANIGRVSEFLYYQF
jgi:alginate O-acetyltransferase complex protein AlgI